MFKGGGENCVLTEKAGGPGESRNGQRGAGQHKAGPWSIFFQAAHVPHILLTVAGVNHGARAQEEESLKKGVRHQMPDTGGESAHADAKEHVTKLRNR